MMDVFQAKIPGYASTVNETQCESDLGALENRITDLTEIAINIGNKLIDIGDGIYGARPETNMKDSRLETAPNGKLDSVRRALDTLSAQIDVIGAQAERLRQIA